MCVIVEVYLLNGAVILVRNMLVDCLFFAFIFCLFFSFFVLLKLMPQCLIDRYAMMRDCWMERTVDRPNFTALVQRLDHVIESNIAAMVSALF